MDIKDEMISQNQFYKQFASLPVNERSVDDKPQVLKLIDSAKGHTGLWTDSARSSEQFSNFLEQSNLRRKLF